MERGRPDNPLEYAPSGEPYQGSAIRQRRKERGLGLRELAALIPYHAGTLSNVENNLATASSETLQKIAEILGFDEDQLHRMPLHPRLSKQRAGASETDQTQLTSSVDQKSALESLKAEVLEVKEQQKRQGQELTEIRARLDGIQEILTTSSPALQQVHGIRVNYPPVRQSPRGHTTSQDIIGTMLTRPGQEPPEGRVIELKGLEDLLHEVIRQLNVLPVLEKPQSGRVIFTFLVEEDPYRHAAELERYWIPALMSVIAKGWDVVQFIWLNEDVQRTNNLVRNILSLPGGPGNYKVYFTKNRPYGGAFDFLAADAPVADWRWAFDLHSSSAAQRHVDAGSLYLPPHHAEIDNILRILMDWEQGKNFGFQPLLRVEQDSLKDLDAAENWDRIVTEVEERPGALFLVMKGFGDNTVPDEQYEGQLKPILNRGDKEAAFVHNAIALRKRRQAAFEEQVHKHKFRQIMPIESLEWYRKTGFHSPDAWAYLLKGEKATHAQQARHLRSIIQRLNKYEGNYEIGLLTGDTSQYDKVFWQVKGRHTVLLENFVSGEELDISITDSTVAAAFKEDFRRLWKSDRVIKDQQYVKEWLSKHAENLEKATVIS
jgi:transcriptional regulator with XRE-family HTH domain